MIKKTNQSKYLKRYMSSITSADRRLIAQFIDEFRDTHTYKDFELRVSGKEVREFLRKNQSSLSFSKFNRMTCCSGITSYNLYSYPLVILLSLKENVKENKHSKAFPLNRVYTINYYGSKRLWYLEWQALLSYVSSYLNCDELLVDAFAGSGYISLEAAKYEYFDRIIQNDASTELFNFYSVMKDEVLFEELVEMLEILPQPSREAYDLVRSSIYKTKDTDDINRFHGRERKHQLQTVSAKRAAYLFYLRHYMSRGSGGLETNRKHTKYYVNDLRKTHELYKKIEISNLYYHNVIREHLDNERCLIVIDAPYLAELRIQELSYGMEFNKRSQHTKLMNYVKNCKAKVIMCGYYNEADDFYGQCLSDSEKTWHCVKILRKSRTGENHEHIWTNFEVDALLSVYDYFELVY